MVSARSALGSGGRSRDRERAAASRRATVSGTRASRASRSRIFLRDDHNSTCAARAAARCARAQAACARAPAPVAGTGDALRASEPIRGEDVGGARQRRTGVAAIETAAQWAALKEGLKRKVKEKRDKNATAKRRATMLAKIHERGCTATRCVRPLVGRRVHVMYEATYEKRGGGQVTCNRWFPGEIKQVSTSGTREGRKKLGLGWIYVAHDDGTKNWLLATRPTFYNAEKPGAWRFEPADDDDDGDDDEDDGVRDDDLVDADDEDESDFEYDDDDGA